MSAPRVNCLLVLSSAAEGVSSESFRQAYNLASSNFTVQIASPSGKNVEFINQDDNNRRWFNEFRSKSASTPIGLETVDPNRYSALLIPSAPGALHDLKDNEDLAVVIKHFIKEKKAICAIGLGVAGLFCAKEDNKQWCFEDYSITAPSVYELARSPEFSSLPLVTEDVIKDLGGKYNCSDCDSIHVIIDRHLITGQNDFSTLTAVQNLTLMCTQKKFIKTGTSITVHSRGFKMDNWQNLSPLEKFDLIGQLLGMRSDVQNGPPPSSSMPDFREDFAKAKHIVVLTGAGVSAESGVPTFRGAGGYWRKWQAQQVATPESFEENPSLVWEFYHYRRELMATKQPNKAHLAIAECEKRLKAQGRKLVVITQNIDELHKRAGSENIYELHGNLFTTRCTKCADIKENRDSPICPALAGKGAPDQDTVDAKIPLDQLPRCKKEGCGGLLRPHVVWFGESLFPETMTAAEKELDECDLCLVVGTSSVVYPAAMFAPRVSSRGVPVAEFNTEETDVTSQLKYHFQGPAGTHIPVALARHDTEPEC